MDPFDTNTTLLTERLVLKPIVDSDIGFVFQGLSHPDVIRYYGISYHSFDATRDQMVWYKDLRENQTGIWFAIRSRDNQSPMGSIGISSYNKTFRKAEIGLWLLPDFWKRGIMQEAVAVFCQYCFDQLHLHRLEAQVETENTACKRLMEKLEFDYEGTMKDCEIKDGKFISLDLYAKLNRL